MKGHIRIIRGASAAATEMQKQTQRDDIVLENAKQFSRFKGGDDTRHQQEFIDKLTQITGTLTNDKSKDMAKRVEKVIMTHNGSSIDALGILDPQIIIGLL